MLICSGEEESAEEVDDEEESETETDVKAAVITTPEAAGLNPAMFIARMVVENPKVLLPLFLAHYSKEENLPDLSEGRPVPEAKLLFWQNLKCVANLMPHKDLPGLCGKWTNICIDFSISQNQRCVIFTKDGIIFDMTTYFILHMWVCYAAQMNGSPALESKAFRKVSYL